MGGAANAVADAAVVRKKRAIFLTEIGADSFTLVNDLLAPRSAKEVELNEITRVLKEHYNPAPLEIAESFHFGTRVRKEGDSIADFTRRATRRASLGSGVGTVIVSSTSRPTAAGRMPFATSVSSRVISSLLVRLRCRTRTKRVKPMCWRMRSRRARPKDTLRVPVLRTTCFLSPRAEVLRRGK